MAKNCRGLQQSPLFICNGQELSRFATVIPLQLQWQELSRFATVVSFHLQWLKAALQRLF